MQIAFLLPSLNTVRVQNTHTRLGDQSFPYPGINTGASGLAV